MKFTFFWVKQSTLVSRVSNVLSKAVKRTESHLNEALLSDVPKRSEFNSLTVTPTPKPLKKKEIQFKIYTTNPRHTNALTSHLCFTYLISKVGCSLNLSRSSKIENPLLKMSEGRKSGSLEHCQ